MVSHIESFNTILINFQHASLKLALLYITNERAMYYSGRWGHPGNNTATGVVC